MQHCAESHGAEPHGAEPHGLRSWGPYVAEHLQHFWGFAADTGGRFAGPAFWDSCSRDPDLLSTPSLEAGVPELAAGEWHEFIESDTRILTSSSNALLVSLTSPLRSDLSFEAPSCSLVVPNKINLEYTTAPNRIDVGASWDPGEGGGHVPCYDDCVTPVLHGDLTRPVAGASDESKLAPHFSALVFEAALKVRLPLMASHFFLAEIRDVMAGFEVFDIAGVVAHTTFGGWVALIYGRGLLLSAWRTKRQDVGSDTSRRIYSARTSTACIVRQVLGV